MDSPRTKRLSQTLLSSAFSKIRKWPELGVVSAFLITFVIFSILAAPRFFTVRNLTGVFTIVSELGIIAIGVAFLMIAGEFDLSAGAVYAISGLLFVTLANHINSPLALIIALAAAATIGLLNGIITIRTRIPSFITTLGMMMLLRGTMLVATGGRTVSYRGDAIVPTMLSRLMDHGLRPSHFWFIALAVLFAFILARTRYGNWVFATGGNKEVARARGVNINRVKIVNFMISALLAGFAGIIVLTRFRLANVAFGTGMELEAIAAVVIGGTFLAGGYGTIIGAFVGAFLMGMMRNGLILSGAPAFWYQAFVGAILILAAAINLRLRRLVM